ncbi:MAG: prepilin-type N-terminal cleavage/methylation domain-containing protein [Zoogloeaceae bacterium]|jgi:prepilin-type N-terminal cleavage/methylation domain-containing protein|nr:prepilin-type N-terminal cleavage/methylation domain-containing protein [Zoogloeaceae bacterium]
MKRCGMPLFAGQGFTLVELLLVIVLLSAVTLAAFDVAIEDRSQVRMEDTRARLGILRRAILGVETPAYGGELRLSGFVADNGRLPESVRDLLDISSYRERKGVQPVFSGALTNECLQTGAGHTFAGVSLLKGHRGNYLAGVARNQAFRDGWGNVGASADNLNFGWQVAPAFVTDTLTISSLGANNQPGGDSEAEIDQSMRVSPEDWRVSLDGWKVRLRYRDRSESGTNALSASGFDPALSDFGDLGLALLVFENEEGEGRWRQYRSAAADVGGNNCQGKTELYDGEECEIRFVAKSVCGGGGERENLVPLGRHLLVLTAKNYALPPEIHRIVREVDFFPGALQPGLTLELR